MISSWSVCFVLFLSLQLGFTTASMHHSIMLLNQNKIELINLVLEQKILNGLREEWLRHMTNEAIKNLARHQVANRFDNNVPFGETKHTISKLSGGYHIPSRKTLKSNKSQAYQAIREVPTSQPNVYPYLKSNYDHNVEQYKPITYLNTKKSTL